MDCLLTVSQVEVKMVMCDYITLIRTTSTSGFKSLLSYNTSGKILLLIFSFTCCIGIKNLSGCPGLVSFDWNAVSVEVTLPSGNFE